MTNGKKAEWTAKLAESRAALDELINSLTPEQWETKVYSEGAEWTVRTVLGHLLEAEQGMSIQVHKIRKGEETVPEGFDIEQWNAGAEERTGTLSPDKLKQALAQTRQKTLEVMGTLNDEEWALTGRHPGRGIISIEQYYATIQGHELMHTKDIQEVLAG